MSSKIEFYTKLKKQLDETTKFPTEYLYKFIVTNDANRVNEVEEIFENTDANIQKKMSKTGKYTSVSISIVLPNSDTVIAYYKKAENIKEIISL